jgi:metal-responsive CopG/Arc/MetJ family transcriptional regulator
MPADSDNYGALIDEARRLGGHRTRKAAVNAALREYVQHRQQAEIVKLFGTVEYWPDYNYKALRRKRRTREA